MRRFLLLLLVVLTVIALPYFVLPTVLEGFVARDVQERLGLAEQPGVKLDSDPQWEMLLGEFSDGRISVDDTNLGGVRAEGVALNLEPFSVSVGESASSRTAVLEEPLSGQVRLQIPEQEVSRLARQNADVPINGVDLRREGVTINSETSVLGTTFPVEVEGDVGVEGNAIVFQPGIVRAAGVTVPQGLADSLLAGTAFQYPVEGLPYGATVTDARTTDGAIVLTGRVSGVEIGAGG